MKNKNQKQLLPLCAVARRLGVAERSLRIEVKAGRISAVKVGPQFLLDFEQVEKELLKRASGNANKPNKK